MGVRSSDIVELFGVTRASVSRMIRRLSELGLLEKDRFGKISLTNIGKCTSEMIYKKAEELSVQLKKAIVCSSKVAEDCALLLLAELPGHFEVANEILN
jgi:Mn-dependent DtxR family transcriptional regulator